MDDVALLVEGEIETSTKDVVVHTKDVLLTSDERYEIWELKSVERPHLASLHTAEETSEVDKEVEDDDEQEETNGGDDCSSCEDTNAIEEHDDGLDEEGGNDDGGLQNEQIPLPLIDGCDLPRWREHRLVRTTTTKQGYLNVGSGCTMMRRESQLPSTVVESRHLQKWNDLKSKLMTTAKTTESIDDEGGGGSTSCSLTPSSVLRISSKSFPLHDLHHPCWFEKDNVPVILDRDFTEHWRAYKTCTFQNLLKDWGDHYWRFSDTHGQTMTLKTYDKYIHSIEGLLDDAPLAVYDSQLHTDDRAVLLEDYDVPPCFLSQQTGDLFTVGCNNNPVNNEWNEEHGDVEHGKQESNQSGEEIDNELDDDDTVDGDNENFRPPFRWILIGPERSG